MQVLDFTREAVKLAGRAFLQYRHWAGTKTGVLHDYFVGAHAAIENFKLLTRDASR